MAILGVPGQKGAMRGKNVDGWASIRSGFCTPILQSTARVTRDAGMERSEACFVRFARTAKLTKLESAPERKANSLWGSYRSPFPNSFCAQSQILSGFVSYTNTHIAAGGSHPPAPQKKKKKNPPAGLPIGREKGSAAFPAGISSDCIPIRNAGGGGEAHSSGVASLGQPLLRAPSKQEEAVPSWRVSFFAGYPFFSSRSL